MTTFVRDLKNVRRKRVGRRPRFKVTMSEEARALVQHAAKISGLYPGDVLDALVFRYVTFPEGEGPGPVVGTVAKHPEPPKYASHEEQDDEEGDQTWLEKL